MARRSGRLPRRRSHKGDRLCCFCLRSVSGGIPLLIYFRRTAPHTRINSGLLRDDADTRRGVHHLGLLSRRVFTRTRSSRRSSSSQRWPWCTRPTDSTQNSLIDTWWLDSWRTPRLRFPKLAAAYVLADFRARGFAVRGDFSANSKPTLPSSSFKCAENGRPLSR